MSAKQIKYDDKFSFSRDAYGWTLYEWREGKDKNGKPKRVATKSYHSNLSQVCRAIIDREAGECENLRQIIEMIDRASKIIPGRC